MNRIKVLWRNLYLTAEERALEDLRAKERVEAAALAAKIEADKVRDMEEGCLFVGGKVIQILSTPRCGVEGVLFHVNVYHDAPRDRETEIILIECDNTLLINGDEKMDWKVWQRGTYSYLNVLGHHTRTKMYTTRKQDRYVEKS